MSESKNSKVTWYHCPMCPYIAKGEDEKERHAGNHVDVDPEMFYTVNLD